jgi:hypothetical protein
MDEKHVTRIYLKEHALAALENFESRKFIFKASLI